MLELKHPWSISQDVTKGKLYRFAVMILFGLLSMDRISLVFVALEG
jgi:hypothetical protein